MPHNRSNQQLDLQSAHRYEAWRELLDFSARLALSGMRIQGFSSWKAWRTWCQRWAKASQEHQQANRRIAQYLNGCDESV